MCGSDCPHGDVLVPQLSLQKGKLKVSISDAFKSWASDGRPYSHGISRGAEARGESRGQQQGQKQRGDFSRRQKRMERRVLQVWDHFRNPANDEAKALTMSQMVLAAP